jgi:hypothetical protein
MRIGRASTTVAVILAGALTLLAAAGAGLWIGLVLLEALVTI